jgi:hypothetical protein
MSESNVINPPKIVTGRGGGGSFGREDDRSPTGDPPDDDLSRLGRMVERINKTLDKLIRLEPRLLPEVLAVNLAAVWPEAQNHFTHIVKILRRELLIAVPTVNLGEELERAGLTGPMLRMKETSLYFYLNQIDGNIEAYQQKYSPSDSPILSYPERKGILRTLFGWLKPGFKVMNSILGSLPDVLPGKEIVKELKEHVEAGYEVAEHLGEQEEG